MKIFICCSKHIYGKVADIKAELEKRGHSVTVPNCYDEPMKEEEVKKLSQKEHSDWKAGMIRLQAEKVAANDAILVLNMEKHGQPNYIGGATFLEIFQAFQTGKKVYLYNPIPEGILKDELIGMGPKVINGDLSMVQ